MGFKKFCNGAFVVAIMSFVVGLLMAFFLPPMIIAVIECVLIIILCLVLKK